MNAGTDLPIKERQISLDALRGFAMFWIQGGELFALALIPLSSQPLIMALAWQLEHCEWTGVHFYDLVFPLFIFISGVAIGLSQKNLSALSAQEQYGFYRKAIRRLFLLLLLGIIYNHGHGAGIPTSLADIRFASVLGRIGITGFIATLLLWNTTIRTQVFTAILILLLYWILQCFIPVPAGQFLDPLSSDGSWNAWIDQHFLPGMRYMNAPSDPEGILSTLPACVNAIAGALTGQFLCSNQATRHWRTLAYLALTGGALLLLGLFWSHWLPLNKHLWTSSYALVSLGWSLLFLALFRLLFDVLTCRWLAYPLVLLGANAIFIYMTKAVIDWEFFVKSLFGHLINLTPVNWQLLFMVLALVVCKLAILNWLYRNKLFIKI